MAAIEAQHGGHPPTAGFVLRPAGTMLAAKLGNIAVFAGFLLMSVVFVLVYVPLGLASKVVLEGAVLLVMAAGVSGFLLQKQIGVNSRLLRKVLLLSG